MTELSPDPDEFSADYAESTSFAGIHGNSGPMRAVKRLRADLLAHMGNKPSSVQLAMVDQAAEIKLRLAVMDETFRRTGRRSAHATGDYLAWSNSFTRLLRQLGLKSPADRGPTLAEILASGPPPRARTSPAVQPDAKAPPAPQPASGAPEASAA
jgi:hypothetical protein